MVIQTSRASRVGQKRKEVSEKVLHEIERATTEESQIQQASSRSSTTEIQKIPTRQSDAE